MRFEILHVLEQFADRAQVLTDIKAKMKQHGISQNALAAFIGCDPSLISKWFTPGPPEPTLESLMRLWIAVDEMAVDSFNV